VAEWLGLDREAAAERTDVVVLPYLDGERTPNLPRSAGMFAGLRHATTREEILLAAYEGAVASLIEALQQLARLGSGLDPETPLILVGGGARGAVWQRVVARLSGRRVTVPDADELVALGAAAQAAACLSGERPDDVARRWGTAGGIEVEPPAEEDTETLARIRATREASLALHEQG
jgi:xylulokinase